VYFIIYSWVIDVYDSTIYGAYTFGCCLGDGGCSTVVGWPPSGLCR